MSDDIKNTTLDYHLTCEEHPDGQALLNASWVTNVPGTKFQLQVECLTDHSVNETMGFLSEVQSRITDLVLTWAAVTKKAK